MSISQKQKSFIRVVAATGIGFAVALTLLVAICYLTAPTHDTGTQHFDVILVLGTPAKRDGTVSNAGKWLMDEAEREFRAGRAEHIIVTGGAVANQFVEADVLAHRAEESGLPASAILEERQARDTLQNVLRSAALMKEHGWNSAEVIGLQEHLPRTSVLLEHTSLQWATHAAQTPGRGVLTRLSHTTAEAIGTTVLRIFGLKAVPFLHRIKMFQYRRAQSQR